MVRITIILLIGVVGLAAGALIGLIAGVALVEFGKQSCSGAGCADVVLRTCVPIAAGIGGALGLAKGFNVVSPRIALR